MLPDFASVIGVPPPVARHPEVGAGIRLHHLTDAVFHRSVVFGELEHRSRSALAGGGMRKGARRAIAHVGLELLIDEQIAARSAAWTGYRSALQFGESEACRSALAWESAAASQRFASLCRHVAVRRPADDRELASRLVACVAGRPRLALRPGEMGLIAPWLAECRPSVATATPGLLEELARELRAPHRSA